MGADSAGTPVLEHLNLICGCTYNKFAEHQLSTHSLALLNIKIDYQKS